MKAARIFQSGMVLQREKPVPVWGTAQPGKQITVEIQGKSGKTKASADGSWSVMLPPLSASESERMEIRCEADEIVLEDIAVGEVWVAAGQSNMEFYMRYEKHLAQEKPDCANPRVRFFDVPEAAFDWQEENFDYSRMAVWRKASPENIEYFSAAGYYFEKKLEKSLDVPVGIIGCSWGGTSSSSWMSADSVRKAGRPWMERYENLVQGMDMDVYWEGQKKNPMNGRGNPCADAFSEMMLPRTPSSEEIDAFFAASPDAGAPPVLQPQAVPGILYEHMVKSIAPYGIRGVLWYQGENDDELNRQELYEAMLKALLSDWRMLWGAENLPFLVVQLPGWESWFGIVNQGWQIIRRCQENVVRQDKNAYLCSISDAGEQYDIHPKNKKTVGERLALLALGHIYGKELLCDAPRLKNASRRGNEIQLHFENADGGLFVKGGQIQALRLLLMDNGTAGRELSFTAVIKEDTVCIKLYEEAEGEILVQFAQEKFYQVNLYNQSGIPAVPFQTEV